MTRDELKNHIRELIGFAPADKQARASEILTSISDGFEEAFTASEQAKATADQLTADNENLRATNMKLFLKVGETAKKDEPHGEGENPDEETKISFDELFNEKGELK